MKHSPARLLLLPLSWIYGLVVGFRNILFNLEIIPSRSFDVPVISIGNITVGGTGKTPHTEFLLQELSKEFNVAVLSRGYKRKTKGFVLANRDSNLSDIGDEPLQMKLKFPEIIVAVDENRCRGIERLTDETQKTFIEIVLLDDAFQHRFVSPSISILLIDYNRLITEDFLLPAGNLRENANQMKRAQIVIVSKCPGKMSPMDIRILGSKINTLPYQSLFFTTLTYGPLVPLYKSGSDMPILDLEGLDSDGIESDNQSAAQVNFKKPENLEQIRTGQVPVLLFTGIASPEKLEETIQEYSPQVKSMFFSDHHEFSKRDAKKISQEFEKIKPKGGILITTEKDATRIRNNPWMKDLHPFIFYPTLKIEFLSGEKGAFLHKIIDYVKINRRHRTIS